MKTELCCLNGEIQPLAEARLHPLDRGFIFGDSLYEALKILGGTLLHVEPHLKRLRHGLGQVEIPYPEGLLDDAHLLLAAAGVVDGFLYIQISRGVAPRAHIPPRGLSPTVLLLASPFDFSPPAGREMSIVTAPDWRWRRCDLKSTSLMGTVLGKLEVRREEVDEVVFVGEEGDLREGGSVNFFVRRDDVLETCPLRCGNTAENSDAGSSEIGEILAGVTRDRLIALARDEGWPVRERAPLLAESATWQEVFVCGTLTGVQPVVRMNGEPVGGGRAGAWTRRLAELHQAYECRLAGL